MRPLELSCSIAHATEGELADPREAIRFVAELTADAPDPHSPRDRACPWIQLDATRRGLRPRDLGRSARRDLAALLRRHELLLSGLDLWIPAEHFVDNARVDRAVMAVAAACELVADLDAVYRVVSLALDTATPGDVLAQLAASADRFGVRLADHTAGHTAATSNTLPIPADRPHAIAVGLDPAACFIAGVDPLAHALARSTNTARRLASARLSDLSAMGRCIPASEAGRLDLTLYAATLTTADYTQPVIIDLRGLPDVRDAARRIARAWRDAAALSPA